MQNESPTTFLYLLEWAKMNCYAQTHVNKCLPICLWVFYRIVQKSFDLSGFEYIQCDEVPHKQIPDGHYP